MSDYELAYLFSEAVNTMGNMFVNHTSGLFAFLAASVLAAPRLSRSLVVIGLSFFSIFQFVSIFQIQRGVTNVGQLGLRIQEQSLQPGSDLSWHAATESPKWIFNQMPLMTIVVLAICYAAALYFFFLCRKGAFSLEVK